MLESNLGDWRGGRRWWYRLGDCRPVKVGCLSLHCWQTRKYWYSPWLPYSLRGFYSPPALIQSEVININRNLSACTRNLAQNTALQNQRYFPQLVLFYRWKKTDLGSILLVFVLITLCFSLPIYRGCQSLYSTVQVCDKEIFQSFIQVIPTL